MGYTLYVRTLTGQVLFLTVEDSTTIKEVKQMIYGQVGIPVDEQRVIHSGRGSPYRESSLWVKRTNRLSLGGQLEEDRCLSDYGIKELATLHVVLRLRGGGLVTPRMVSSSSTGFAVGGAKDVTNFRDNVEKGLVPKPSSITYEVRYQIRCVVCFGSLTSWRQGLFNEYYFDTGANTTTQKNDLVFWPRLPHLYIFLSLLALPMY